MIQSTDILVENSTGNTFEFIETGHETNGARVSIKVSLKSKGKYAPGHIHVIQDETFKVLSGTMSYILDGNQGTVLAGDHVVMPKGVPHNHYNGHDEPLEMIQTIEPAIDIDYYLLNYIGLSNDGKVKNGDAGLLQNIVTLKYLDSPTYLSDIPIGAQKLLMNVVAPIARVIGYRALYSKYTGIEK